MSKKIKEKNEKQKAGTANTLKNSISEKQSKGEHLTVMTGKNCNIVELSLPNNFFEQIITNEIELSEGFEYDKLTTLVHLYLNAIQYYSSFAPEKVLAYQNRMEYLLTQRETLKNLCKKNEEEKVKSAKSSTHLRDRLKTKFMIESKAIKKDEIKRKVTAIKKEHSDIKENKKSVKILINSEFESQSKKWKEKLAKKRSAMNSIRFLTRTSGKKYFKTPGPVKRTLLNIDTTKVDVSGFEKSGKNLPMPRYRDIDDISVDDNKSENAGDVDFIKMFKDKHDEDNKKDSDDGASIINEKDSEDALVKIDEVEEENEDRKKSGKNVNEESNEKNEENVEKKQSIKGILKKSSTKSKQENEINENEAKEKEENKEEKEEKLQNFIQNVTIENKNEEKKEENIEEENNEKKEEEKIEKKEEEKEEKKEKENNEKKEEKNEEEKEEKKEEENSEKKEEKKEEKIDNKEGEKEKIIEKNEKEEEKNIDNKEKEEDKEKDKNIDKKEEENIIKNDEDKNEKEKEKEQKKDGEEDNDNDNDLLAAKNIINENNDESINKSLKRKVSIVDENVIKAIKLDDEISGIIEEKMKILDSLKNGEESGEDSNNPSTINLPIISKKVSKDDIPPIFQETLALVEEKMNEYVVNLKNHLFKEAFDDFSVKLKELYDSKYKKYIMVNNEYHSSITENEYLLENDENLTEEKKTEIQSIIDSLKEEQKDQIDKIVDEYNNNIILLINEFKQNSFRKNTSVQLLEEQLKLDIYSIINESFY